MGLTGGVPSSLLLLEVHLTMYYRARGSREGVEHGLSARASWGGVRAVGGSLWGWCDDAGAFGGVACLGAFWRWLSEMGGAGRWQSHGGTI